jgi:hypothetical protein
VLGMISNTFLALRKLRQKDLEFKASMDYIVRSYLKKKNKKKKTPKNPTRTSFHVCSSTL